jgi:CRISPR-associated endonuclease/helicase Cas3
MVPASMREIIAVCRSRKSAREKVSSILDQYFWRIGDRTWRGQASNACLDRVSRELRATANRATAVSIQEIRSSHESRLPIIRIGSKSAFSDAGLTPVSHHSDRADHQDSRVNDRHIIAIVRIAALFHDFGKATLLFQNKLQSALKNRRTEPDAVRHELFSAALFDHLVGSHNDHDLIAALKTITVADFDRAWGEAQHSVSLVDLNGKNELKFSFLNEQSSVAFSIGMLILTHHRIPGGDSSHIKITAKQHTSSSAKNFTRADLDLAAGEPFWRESWFIKHLRKDAYSLSAGGITTRLDIALRGALMLADHLGSSQSEASVCHIGHLANTKMTDGGIVAADSLSRHVRRVYSHCRSAVDLLHRWSDRFPAFDETDMPSAIVKPQTESSRFRWQVDAAAAARALCSAHPGGFFGCIVAGTGTGKTRGAPTIMAAAAFGDALPHRRYFRMTLGLGLRVLASQSAREYVDDLGFPEQDVCVLIGKKPIDFDDRDAEAAVPGSESQSILPEWLRVETIDSKIPDEDDESEGDWARGLSINTDREVPAFLSIVAEHAQKKGRMFKKLASAPIIVATVDHLMPIAAPVKSGFLPALIRVATSDLILDEIDQYGAEDIAAIARLVFQTASSGRRVIIMSATVTDHIYCALYDAYAAGWSEYARVENIPNRVNILCTSDAPRSYVTNANGEAPYDVYHSCVQFAVGALKNAEALRRGLVLPHVEKWEALVAQIDQSCSEMHDLNAVEIGEFKVSVGLVRMTRISHTSALAAQLPAGNNRPGRLRLKLCLHSHFPRLHRAFIETWLKRALTRKSDDPNAGLRRLCQEFGVFTRASAAGIHNIEIVCITSPVIETGNDLDFDYAIIDPTSMRAVVQSAGRVRRHRRGAAKNVNTLILGRSAIVMQTGSLVMPGVETPPNSATRVTKVSLTGDKRFSALLGDASVDIINAGMILSNDKACPLRDAENTLVQKMLSRDHGAPLSIYMHNVAARMNKQFTESRTFRRSTTSSVVYTRVGTSYENSEWRININPRRPFEYLSPHDALEELSDIGNGWLMTDMNDQAISDYSKKFGKISKNRLSELFSVSIPMYGDFDKEVQSTMTYFEKTGFTRGPSGNLFNEFGS